MAPPAPPYRLPWRRSPLLAALFAWVVPGLGHVYAGRARKGALMLAAILPVFLAGWFFTRFTGIDPGQYPLDFVAQALIGGPTAAAMHWVGHPTPDHVPRWLEMGRLYLQVAGLLNLIAIGDAVGDVILWNRGVLKLREEAAEAQADARAEAEARAAAPAGSADAWFGPDAGRGAEPSDDTRSPAPTDTGAPLPPPVLPFPIGGEALPTEPDEEHPA